MFVTFSTGSTSALEIVGPSNALYVDVAGNDATGTRGNAARPYLTMAAALADAQGGDEILVSPGLFSGAFALPALANLTIRGSGSFAGDTILTAVAAANVCTLNAANRSILFDNIQIAGLTSGRAVIGTGAAAGGAWLSSGNGLVFQNCVLSSATGDALVLTNAGLVLLRDSIISVVSTQGVICTTCSSMIMQSTINTGTMTWTFDNTDANKPAAGQSSGLELLAGSKMSGTTTLGGQAKIATASGSELSTLTALNLSVAAGPVSPSIRVSGKCGAVDFSTTTAALPSAVLGAFSVLFTGATFTGATFLVRVASGATRQPVGMVGTRAEAAFAITSDALCDIVAQGAAYKTPTYTCLNTGALGIGTLQPPSLTLTAANTNPTTFTFANTLNVPTGYGIAAINSVAAGAVTGATTMSATQVVITHAAGGGNVTITLTWP